jgi:ABC-type sugar transport system substrate-binding protein
VSKTIFVLLLGNEQGEPADLFQDLLRKEAVAAGEAEGYKVEVVCSPGFDQYRLLRKRLGDTSSPVDAVLTEPANAATMGLMLKALKGSTSLVFLNAWDPLIEQNRADWGAGKALGAVSTPHAKIGEIQAAQVSAVVPPGGEILVVTGPSRSAAAPERLEGLRSKIRSDIEIHETEAGQWTEAAGIMAFNSFYGVFKSRHTRIHAIVGQSDDIAMGAREAALAVPSSEHARMFAEAKLFGVGGCPGFGKDLVDDGTLHASIILPPNTGLAISLLKSFWTDGRALPLRSFTEVHPCPPTSVQTS